MFKNYDVVMYVSEPLIRTKIMSGKLVLEWSHPMIKDMAVKRYLSTQESLRNTHGELANLFFSEFCEDNSESEDEPGKYLRLLLLCSSTTLGGSWVT